MWVRRAFFGWLLPAVFLLPLWLFIGWGVFDAGGWAFLWVLFIAIPSVFLGQILLTVLTRSRPSVRVERAVSWWDVTGYGLWHALTVSLGFYVSMWWAPVMVLAVIVGVALVWLQIWQLLREVRPREVVLRASSGAAYIPPQRPDARSRGQETTHPVVVVDETPRADR